MMRDSATEYMRNLDTQQAQVGDTYTLQVRPQKRRDNPELDYMKMVFMVAGAVVAGILYDKSKNRNG